MLKKFNTKTLIIIFAVLLAIVIINNLIDTKKGERTFREELVNINIDEITDILIYPRAENHQEVRLRKTANDWEVEKDKFKATADSNVVKNMLATLQNIKPKRLAATDNSKWEDYQVNDSLGTRIKIIEKDKTTLDLIIGKFSFKQQGKVTTSYVRLAEEENVYAVDGILSMTFNQGIDYWRNKTVIRGTVEDWTRLSFQYPADSSFLLSRQNDKWMLNGILTDSAKTAQYLNSIASLNNNNFVDEFKPIGIQPLISLKIEGNNLFEPIEIKAFAADSIHQYFLTSSQNPNTSFSGAQNKMFEKIFAGKRSFMQDVESE